MKKAWIINALIWVITAVAMTMLPDEIPLHYNFEGEIDRWGSKYESFLFPAIAALSAAIFYFVMRSIEKKGSKAEPDSREAAEARANMKVLGIIATCTQLFLTVMQCFILYEAYQNAGEGSAAAAPGTGIGTAMIVMMGVLFLILGNIMPKAKMNRAAGVRLKWSMYNDNTWRKSNRFGGIVLMLTGAAIILTALLANFSAALILLLVLSVMSGVVVVLYSYKVYREELNAAKTS